MSGQIFISYRREDSAGFAGRIFDRLQARFGDNRIFMDVSGIKLGVDFVQEIERAVGQCDALIVLIGKKWLSAQDESGNIRLENPEDFVRLEIVSALERDIRVIPALVGGASMPRSQDLPESLKPLARRQGLEISHVGFDEDVARLIDTIEEVFREAHVQEVAPGKFETIKTPKLEIEKPKPKPRSDVSESWFRRLPNWGRGLFSLVGLGILAWIGFVIFTLLGGGSTAADITKVSPQEIVDADNPMILIPAGKFLMGDDEGEPNEWPAHGVYLDDFYIDQYEVTNYQYALCVEDGKCQPPPESSSFTRESYYGNPEYANYPVVNIVWESAATFCAWRGGRLPSEAEWEKAARGGLDGNEYTCGDEHPVCDSTAPNGAKFDDDQKCDATDTDAVGSYAPNGYGLYDMAGNVWEWVADYYAEDYYQEFTDTVENPLGPDSGGARVVRGGAWDESESALRVAARGWYDPTAVLASYGFRCVRDAQP